MPKETQDRLTLQGVFDRTLAGEAALVLEEREADGIPAPVIDASELTLVLMEGALLLRQSDSLRRCQWENVPTALVHYTGLLGFELPAAGQAMEPSPEREQPPQGTRAPSQPAHTIAQCPVCANSMRLPPNRPGRYACPHCRSTLSVDAGGRPVALDGSETPER